MFTFATAHALVGGGYLPPNYFAVFFRALNIGVLGGGFPDEFLPEESLPDATGFGDLVMKIAIFLTGLYIVNMVMMNFLIAVMGDTFERVIIAVGLTEGTDQGHANMPSFGELALGCIGTDLCE